MNKEAAKELESWLIRNFRGYGYYIEAGEDDHSSENWKVTIT